MTIQQQLDLIWKLDRIFDQVQDETPLVLSLTSLLAEALDADLALIALPEEDHHHKIRPVSVIDRGQILTQIPEEELYALLQEIARLGPGSLLRRRLKLSLGSLYLVGAAIRILP